MKLLDKLFGKNQLDEMQEQKLRLIESRGFWVTWCALLAAMVVESFLGATARELAGEWIVFLSVDLYILVECLRNGLWDRRLKANHATNLVASLLAGVAIILFQGLLTGYWLGALLTGAFTFLLCIGLLEFCCALYKRRHKALEQGEQDEPENDKENP